MTYPSDPAYAEDYNGYTDGAPDHAAGYPVRRPRLWHALALAAVTAWVLMSLIRPSSCDALAANSPSIPMPTPPTTTAPAWADSPVTISARPGATADGFAQCQVLGTRLERLECLTDSDQIYPVPQYESWRSASASAESSYASATSSAASAQASANSAHRAAVDKCQGSRGGFSGVLQWLAIILSIGSVIIGWRRMKVYVKHKRDCLAVDQFDRTYPEGEEWRARHEELEAVVPAAYDAASEAFSQRIHWFGGNPVADEGRADRYHDVATRANAERKRRLGGGWVPGMGGDGDLPEPKLPPQTPATPTAQSAGDWRAALASDSEDW